MKTAPGLRDGPESGGGLAGARWKMSSALHFMGFGRREALGDVPRRLAAQSQSGLLMSSDEF